MCRGFHLRTIMPILTSDLKARLVAQALAEGFRNAKITKPDAVPQVPAQLDAFLQAGYHGQMTWMETRKEWRAAPQVLWPDARSVVMLAESYGPQSNPWPILIDPISAISASMLREKTITILSKNG